MILLTARLIMLRCRMVFVVIGRFVSRGLVRLRRMVLVVVVDWFLGGLRCWDVFVRVVLGGRRSLRILSRLWVGICWYCDCWVGLFGVWCLGTMWLLSRRAGCDSWSVDNFVPLVVVVVGLATLAVASDDVMALLGVVV